MNAALGLLAVLFVMLAPGDAAADGLPDPVAVAEAAIGNSLPEVSLTNIDGERVPLSRFRDRPLLLSMIYTGCADVCPLIIENLRPAVEIAQSALGEESFAVITIGFDTRNDTPERMRSFARSRGIDLPNWWFLSASRESIDALAAAVGFTIVPSAGGFGHMAQVSIIDPQGRVYQQVVGGEFEAPAIVEPLKDLLFDNRKPLASLAGLAERVKLFCTVYNPNTGRYYFNYSLFIGIIIGLASLLTVLLWLVREFRLSGGPRGGAHP